MSAQRTPYPTAHVGTSSLDAQMRLATTARHVPSEGDVPMRERVGRVLRVLIGWAALDEIAHALVARYGSREAPYAEEFARIRAEAYNAIFAACLNADPDLVCRRSTSGGGFDYALRPESALGLEPSGRAVA